ncbi:MAG TPA: AMP-dependent synthetase/ligase [Pirellulales bacterium]|jgi:long-chain acyl-CoA synthetase|nr:AMP-dependent synthetase/ligase [Pirellulales bacterium]
MPSAEKSATVISLLCEQVAARGSQTALLIHRGPEWVPVGWEALLADVRRAAAALRRRGVERGDRVVLLSPNRYEWIVADLAIQMAQAVQVPVHASLAGPQIVYQIRASGARLLLISGEEQAEKLVRHAELLPAPLAVLAFDACPEAREHLPLVRFSEVLHDVDEAAAEQVQAEALRLVEADDLATILFTSGTTGEPKGVMLSQKNLASNAASTLEIFGQREADRRLTWLPFSHIFARTCDLYTWLASGCELALADTPESVLANCRQLLPTLLNGVPYFFEKVYRHLVEQSMVDKPGALAALFGGKMRMLVSGGAPLPLHVARCYQQQGMLLIQGYGLTESSPVIATETERHHQFETVGRPIPGVEVKISPEGEILTRGPHVMLGYWNDPTATAAVLHDGWLATGDLGEINAEGYLKITGRKKELIVTAGGKNIAPAHLESLLIEEPLIQQALVVGDARNYLTALIVPDPEALKAALAANRIQPGDDVLADARVRRVFKERIDQRLAVVSRYEQVQDFVLLDRPFSAERGEVTPTLKLRRNRILANNADAIAAMYADKPRF